MVEVKFEGTPEEVDKQVARYMQDYHPAGYGTRIVSSYVSDDGIKHVKVERWYTSD